MVVNSEGACCAVVTVCRAGVEGWAAAGAGVAFAGGFTGVLLNVMVPRITVVWAPVVWAPVGETSEVAVACPPGAPLPAKIFVAAVLSVQPTNTPRLVFIGKAKHSLSPEHTDITKLPSLLQFPTLPDMHAIWPELQEEEKFSPENSALYP